VLSPDGGSARTVSAAAPAILLISDVDDTVKITHVTRRWKAAARALLRRTVFGGMAALYREMNPALVFISASPRFLEGRLRRTLVERGGFPSARFVLRDWSAERDVVAFKNTQIAASCAASPLPVVLVGDDTEHDPEVFLSAATRQDPGRVLAIYIRQNLGRALPSGVVPFRTAFDIAVHEHRQGRMSVAASLRVGTAVIEAVETRSRHVLPPFYRSAPRRDVGADSGGDGSRAAREIGEPALAQMAAAIETALR